MFSRPHYNVAFQKLNFRLRLDSVEMRSQGRQNWMTLKKNEKERNNKNEEANGAWNRKQINISSLSLFLFLFFGVVLQTKSLHREVTKVLCDHRLTSNIFLSNTNHGGVNQTSKCFAASIGSGNIIYHGLDNETHSKSN